MCIYTSIMAYWLYSAVSVNGHWNSEWQELWEACLYPSPLLPHLAFPPSFGTLVLHWFTHLLIPFISVFGP